MSTSWHCARICRPGFRPAGEAERSGKREYFAAHNEALPVQERLARRRVKCTKKRYRQSFCYPSSQHCRVPCSRQQVLRTRSQARRQAEVLRSVQRSTASAGTTPNAFGGVRASICFQHSAYTTRSATLRVERFALFVGDQAPRSSEQATLRVERFALFVGDQAPRSSEQDGALPSRPSTASQDKADRSKRTKPVAQREFVAFSLFDLHL